MTNLINNLQGDAVLITRPDPKDCVVAHRRVMRRQAGAAGQQGAAIVLANPGELVGRSRAQAWGLIDAAGQPVGEPGIDLWANEPEPPTAA